LERRQVAAYNESMLVYAVDKAGLPPFEMPGRFKTEAAYFTPLPGIRPRIESRP
jgi:hypothetical protein